MCHCVADNLPLKMGHIFHTPRPPMPRCWPSEASRKNAGTPARIRQNRYGTRNAPRGDRGDTDTDTDTDREGTGVSKGFH